jgi:DNA-binding HxlR family transcriptional regulator
MTDTLCPVARTVDRVGDAWSLMILRDAFHGLTRFDQFQKSLGVASNILTRRLAKLTEAGLLERRRYQARPPRFEYGLTARCGDFWPVLVAMMAYGNRHFATEGVASTLVDTRTGAEVTPVLADAASGEILNPRTLKFAAGPAADDAVRARMAFADSRR